MTPPDVLPQDREVLAAVFASRVSLAKKTAVEAQNEALDEWMKTQKWVISTSKKEGSFLWMCEEFDLDAGAVRRAIGEKK